MHTAHATLALSGVHQARNLTVWLTAGTCSATRNMIGYTKGILIECSRPTSTQAFHTLVRLSQQHNIKLRTVCENLAATEALPDQ
ncbi:AmiR/NasT family two-component response regulator [Nakamurella sp. UYEF19]|uniref:ANTAR domain-containing protein n=1 Tax=Nakamurella sp. UYEF19 TaxID=1756392 RepID=UPI0033978FC5